MKIDRVGTTPPNILGAGYKNKPPFVPAGSEDVLSPIIEKRRPLGVHAVVLGASRAGPNMIGASYSNKLLIPTSGAESAFGRMPKLHKIGVYEPVEIGKNYAPPGKERF